MCYVLTAGVGGSEPDADDVLAVGNVGARISGASAVQGVDGVPDGSRLDGGRL